MVKRGREGKRKSTHGVKELFSYFSLSFFVSLFICHLISSPLLSIADGPSLAHRLPSILEANRLHQTGEDEERRRREEEGLREKWKEEERERREKMEREERERRERMGREERELRERMERDRVEMEKKREEIEKARYTSTPASFSLFPLLLLVYWIVFS